MDRAIRGNQILLLDCLQQGFLLDDRKHLTLRGWGGGCGILECKEEWVPYAEFQMFLQQAIALDVRERIELIVSLVRSLSKEEMGLHEDFEVGSVNAILDRISASGQLDYCNVGLDGVREALKNDAW